MSKLKTLLQGNSFHTTQCLRHNFIGPICSGKDSFSRRSDRWMTLLSLDPRFYPTKDQGISTSFFPFSTGVKTSADTSLLNSYQSNLWFWSVTIPSNKLALLVCRSQMKLRAPTSLQSLDLQQAKWGIKRTSESALSFPFRHKFPINMVWSTKWHKRKLDSGKTLFSFSMHYGSYPRTWTSSNTQ